MPAQGAISAHRETNLLILTDTAANIRRLLDILKLVDVEVALDELQIIPLKHADAQELAQLLDQLFGGRLRRGAAPARRRPPPPPAPRASRRPPAPAPAGGRAATRAADRAPSAAPTRWSSTRASRTWRRSGG